jgi:hypothetical protein
MDRWFSDHQYSTREIQGYVAEDKTFIPGLHGVAWDYVKSMNKEELEENRTYLVSLLQARDHHYINEYWRNLEPRFIHGHTKLLANLGSTSSQRSESYHVVIREITNGRISVKESVKRIVKKVKSMLITLEYSEDKALTKYPHLL